MAAIKQFINLAILVVGIIPIYNHTHPQNARRQTKLFFFLLLSIKSPKETFFFSFSFSLRAMATKRKRKWKIKGVRAGGDKRIYKVYNHRYNPPTLRQGREKLRRRNIVMFSPTGMHSRIL